MHQRHMGGDVGEINRLLDRRIAAADDDNPLAPKEESVAGGAGGDAKTLELLLARQAQPSGLGARRDNERVAGVNLAEVAEKLERAAAEPRFNDMIRNEFRADMLGLGAHLVHQPGALDRLGEAGVVLDIGGDHQLPALLEAGDQHRLQHRAGGIDRRRIAGGAGAQNNDAGVARGGGWRHGVSFSRGAAVRAQSSYYSLGRNRFVTGRRRQIVTRAPSSTTRSEGIEKKSVALADCLVSAT